MSNLINITSHILIDEQIQNAVIELEINKIINLPNELQEIWSNIPPENKRISSYIAPVLNWLDSVASVDDFIVVQGDYGATFLVVTHCHKKYYKPYYITTKRETNEEVQDSGSIKITRIFKHVQFRMYEKI